MSKALIIAFAAVAFQAAALSAQEKLIIQSVSGDVSVSGKDSAQWRKAEAGMELHDGMRIAAGNRSQALAVSSNSMFRIGAFSISVVVMVSRGEDDENEGGELVIISEVPAVPPGVSGLIPPPPVGTGRNSRIKLEGRRNPVENIERTFADPLRAAGFDSNLRLKERETVTLKINLIFP